MAEILKDVKWKYDKTSQLHEANYLKLDSSKAHNKLKWHPNWQLKTAIQKTLEWHEAWRRSEDMRSFTFSQIKNYQSLILED